MGDGEGRGGAAFAPVRTFSPAIGTISLEGLEGFRRNPLRRNSSTTVTGIQEGTQRPFASGQPLCHDEVPTPLSVTINVPWPFPASNLYWPENAPDRVGLKVTACVTPVSGSKVMPSGNGWAAEKAPDGAAAREMVRGMLPLLLMWKVSVTGFPTGTDPKLSSPGVNAKTAAPVTADPVNGSDTEP